MLSVCKRVDSRRMGVSHFIVFTRMYKRHDYTAHATSLWCDCINIYTIMNIYPPLSHHLVKIMHVHCIMQWCFTYINEVTHTHPHTHNFMALWCATTAEQKHPCTSLMWNEALWLAYSPMTNSRRYSYCKIAQITKSLICHQRFIAIQHTQWYVFL